MATSRTKARITPLLFEGGHLAVTTHRKLRLSGSVGHYRRQTNETTSTGLLRASAAWLQMAVSRFDFFCA
jgi:hypothetical protein